MRFDIDGLPHSFDIAHHSGRGLVMHDTHRFDIVLRVGAEDFL